METGLIVASGALLILVIFLMLSIKNWPGIHSFCVFITACAGIFVLILFAVVKDYRDQHSQNLVNARKQSLQLTDDLAEITKTVRSLHGSLRRVVQGRGRVWRGVDIAAGQNAQAGGAQFTLTFSDDLKPHGIPQSRQLFLFVELTNADQPVDGEVQKVLERSTKNNDAAQTFSPGVPVVYLGQYNVDNATDDTLTVTSAGPDLVNKTFARQIPADADGRTKVAVYEKMPTDGHLPFAVSDHRASPIIEGGWLFDDFTQDASLEDGAARKRLKVQKIFLQTTALSFGAQMNDPNVQALADALAKEFYQDGSIILDDTLPVANRYKKIRFTKQTTYRRQLNADVPLNPDFLEFFDNQGRAISENLKLASAAGPNIDIAGDQVTFKEDAIGVFRVDEATTEFLAPDGEEPSATELTHHFVRSMRDYQIYFLEIDDFVGRMSQRRESALRNIEDLLDTKARVEKQIEDNKVEKRSLETDLEFHTRDQVEVANYQAELVEVNAFLTVELARLYERNQELATLITQRQKQMADEIDARTDESAEAAEAVEAGSE